MGRVQGFMVWVWGLGLGVSSHFSASLEAIRYRSSTHFPFSFWGLVIKAEHLDNVALIMKGLLGKLAYPCLYRR